MPRTIHLLSVMAIAAVAAGCAKEPVQEEIVYVDPTPITVEPVYHGKYGYQ